jgi:hypothetical protein
MLNFSSWYSITNEPDAFDADVVRSEARSHDWSQYRILKWETAVWTFVPRHLNVTCLVGSCQDPLHCRKYASQRSMIMLNYQNLPLYQNTHGLSPVDILYVPNVTGIVPTWLLLRGGIVQTSHALRPFTDLLCFPVWVLIIPDPSTRAVWQIPAEMPSSEAGRNLVRNVH